MNNIILIGMPGAGKSTLGVILAKTLGLKFIDTDLVIQETTGRLLQDIIDTDGAEAFKKIEEKTILSLDCHHAVIATGGSVVFSRQAMDHLKTGGVVIYVQISFQEMARRLKNITTRGIVLIAGQGLLDMYNQRIPLYEKYADITVDCSVDAFETSVEKVIDVL
ncbi:MAG: shikimate kinase [Methanoregula sp.]|nr:shikimate kinase [Methanoregula sp.]